MGRLVATENLFNLRRICIYLIPYKVTASAKQRRISAQILVGTWEGYTICANCFQIEIAGSLWRICWNDKDGINSTAPLMQIKKCQIISEVEPESEIEIYLIPSSTLFLNFHAELILQICWRQMWLNFKWISNSAYEASTPSRAEVMIPEFQLSFILQFVSCSFQTHCVKKYVPDLKSIIITY